MMKLSILIPTCARPVPLLICVKEILRQRQALGKDATEIEVLIGNDSLEPLAPEVVALGDISVVPGPRSGPAANRNSLAKMAKGEYLVFLDDDCVPQPGFLEAYLVATTQQSPPDILEGRIRAPEPPRYADQECPINESGGVLWSANMAVAKHRFESLNGFDEDFPFAAMEDVDFRIRASRCDTSIVFIPGATVLHQWERRSGTQRFVKQEYSIMLFAYKHPDRIARVQANYDRVARLRYVKQRIFQRKWIQPVSAYKALLETLRFMKHMHSILVHPARISEELRRAQLALGKKPFV